MRCSVPQVPGLPFQEYIFSWTPPPLGTILKETSQNENKPSKYSIKYNPGLAQSIARSIQCSLNSRARSIKGSIQGLNPVLAQSRGSIQCSLNPGLPQSSARSIPGLAQSRGSIQCLLNPGLAQSSACSIQGLNHKLICLI